MKRIHDCSPLAFGGLFSPFTDGMLFVCLYVLVKPP
jgi:hypothetical protein